MMWTSAGIGRVYAGERDIVVRPKTSLGDKVGIIYVHGAEGEFGGGLTWLKVKERIPLFHALTRAGHTIVSADLGDVSTWGNDTVLSRITLARTFLQSLDGVLPGKVILIGQSMGGLASLLWAKNNPSLTKCVVGLVPVINLTDLHDNHGLGSAIDSAYGGAYSEAVHGATHNPYTISSGFAGIKIQIQYGATDTLCLPSFATSFCTASGAQAIALDGGHAESTVGKVNPQSVLDFINAA